MEKELKIKTMQRNEMLRLMKKTYKRLEVEKEDFCGIVGSIKMEEVKEPFSVNERGKRLKIIENGYTWIQFAPKGKHWWLTTMFDESEKFVEAYFDVTVQNYLEDKMNPYFIDLKLDVVLREDRTILVLDEDELDEAFEAGIISGEERVMALEECEKIVRYLEERGEEFVGRVKEYYNTFKTIEPESIL